MLKSGAASIGLHLCENQLRQFELYKDFLIEYNKKINLTRICDEKDIVTKHFLDCLFCVPHITNGSSVADVGTGAGFPGIVIKIALPEIKLTLIDSLMKRVKFLQRLADKLGLQGVEALHIRGEDAAKHKSFAERFDFVTSRAVASVDKLCDYQLPLVKRGGKAIMMKGVQIEGELSAACKKIEGLGFYPAEKFIYTIPHSDISHCILSLERKNRKKASNRTNR